MKVIWFIRAEQSMRQIEKYILSKFGENTRARFILELEQSIQSLSEMPEIGPIDPLLAHRSKTYRSIIVHRMSKLVYYVQDDTIHIAAFWDTRREPQSQVNRLK